MLGRLNHVALVVPDLEKATEHYQVTLGATVSDIVELMHHLCYEVDDIVAARDQLLNHGARVLGNGEPKTGAHGKPVLFLHPKDFFGTLIELEQS